VRRMFWLLLAAPLAATACTEEGLALFVEEDYKKAAHVFERAVADSPKSADCRLWLGRAYGRRAERMSGLARIGALSLGRKLRVKFTEAVELEPRNLVALQSLFDFHVEAPGIVGGDVDQARALAKRIAAIDEGQGLRAQSALHRRDEEWPEAEAALRRAIELEPEDVGHQLSLASFLARRGRFAESDRLFERLRAEHPDDPNVWFAFGKELSRAKRRLPEARKLLERYLRTPLSAPDAEPYSNARSLLPKR